MAFCTQCGKQLSDGTKFCTECGFAIPETEPAAAPEPAAEPKPEAVPEFISQSDPIPEPEPEFKPDPAPEPEPAPVTAPQPKPQSEPAPGPADAAQPAEDPKKTLISSLGFVGINCLLAIPVVGFILLIVWACGGCKKLQKTYYCRSLLITSLIILGITLLFVIVVGAIILATGNNFDSFFQEIIRHFVPHI